MKMTSGEIELIKDMAARAIKKALANAGRSGCFASFDEINLAIEELVSKGWTKSQATKAVNAEVKESK
jgi:hypothetical protein